MRLLNSEKMFSGLYWWTRVDSIRLHSMLKIWRTSLCYSCRPWFLGFDLSERSNLSLVVLSTSISL